MSGFNIILDSRGKGNKRVDRNAIKESERWIQKMDVLYIPSREFEFTWSNKKEEYNRIYNRIDHMFCNEEWNNKFHNYHLDYETPTFSNHSPGVLSAKMTKNLGPKPFKFIK